MERESIRVTRSVSLPLSEIELRVSRSSGPGGQHAHKSETRVEAVFDLEATAALTERQQRRVVARAGPGAESGRQDERSQARNRELAIERLVEKLRAALAVPRRRSRRSRPPRRGSGGREEAPRRDEEATTSSGGVTLAPCEHDPEFRPRVRAGASLPSTR